MRCFLINGVSNGFSEGNTGIIRAADTEIMPVCEGDVRDGRGTARFARC